MNEGQTKEYSLAPFFQFSQDFLCIAGFDGYFKRVNPALCAFLEYSEEELFAQPINDFIYPEDQEITEKHRNNLRGGEPLLKFENRYITKSGKVVWLSWTSMPRVDEQLVYAIAKDVTHKKQIEANKDKVLAELTQTNSHLKNLNFTTAHDLRAPLSSLMLLFEMLDTESISDPEVVQLIKSLKSESKHIKEKIDRYVDKIKSDQSLQRVTQTIRFEKLFDEVRESLDYYIKDTGTQFDSDFEECPTVDFNEVYLESIFLNLISNAIKYAHHVRTPEISIKSRVEDGRTQLLFSDNGIGFDKKVKGTEIFKLGSPIHQNGDSKGVGLYLVNQYMTSMGGSISVESTPGEGTTFLLNFPMV
jgi:PAS domain S-box-containing protein